ncbi:hypothetical protein DM790_22960 [Flavobacterium collinsii]|nr:hypothetical protein [Flavobacterium collinsii]
MNNPLKIIVRGAVLVFALICFGGYMFSLRMNNEYRQEHPKTKSLEELKAWAQTQIIQDYCHRYSYVKTINNETSQQRELSRVDNSRYLYVPQLVRNVIEDNDLPDSYADELFHYVDKEIDKCQ